MLSHPEATPSEHRTTNRARRRAPWRITWRHFAIAALAGCGGFEPTAPHTPITDPQKLYMSLTLDHRAINLSTAAAYRTLQLTATPRDATGAPMSGLPAPTFRSSDTTSVRVSADGLIEARAQATEVFVIAELTADGNVRHVDTAVVNVTTNQAPPTLASISIQPVPPDSAKWSMLSAVGEGYGLVLLLLSGVDVFGDFLPSVSARAFDTSGQPMPALAIAYESLDPAVIQISRRTGDGSIPSRPGQARIVARTTAYGITKADTVVYTVTLPVLNTVRFAPVPDGAPAFTPSEVTIGPNGMVFWASLNGAGPMDVTFDDPANIAEVTSVCAAFSGVFCEVGNIPAVAGFAGEFFFDGSPELFDKVRGRRFPVPGVYTYRNTITGATGRVVVTDGAATTSNVH